MNPDKESSGKPTVEELIKENQSQREQLKKAQAEIERPRKLLEEALRSLKRQAAPFSKGKAKSDPKRPRRKGGSDYGQRNSARFRIVWMRRLQFRCRRSVPTAAGRAFT